ncbi:MAG: hypothetical protein IJX34_00350 [Clostridia bacterium]|nr:hypothetical protein [Clostridia bacterium]
MEEKIQVIKNNLTGNIEEDINFLNSLYEEERLVIEEATSTIEAINIVLEEIKKAEDKEEVKEDINEENQEQENEELVEKTQEEIEIDNKIAELLEHIGQESDEEALKSIEELIPRLESLTKNEDGVLYCSFKNEFEKKIFERIFAGEKQVVATTYPNDIIYTIYSDLLLKKKKYSQALEALDRAIYWNFLSREAREKKLDIYFDRKEIVKYLDSLRLLHMISYTAEDIASCYNKYGFIFNYLKDNKSTYAMYRLSYDYFQNDEVANLIASLEQIDSTLKELTDEEIFKLAQDNEVMIGANTKIIKAQRSLIKDLIDGGYINEAKIMLENDYSMTREDEIAQIYNQLLELEQKVAEQVEEENEEVEEKVEEEKPKKKRTTTKKATTTKTKTTKEKKAKEDKKEE